MSRFKQIDLFVEKIHQSALKEQLSAVLLYGKQLRQESPNQKTFHLMFVFSKIQADSLQLLADLLCEEMELNIEPFILIISELQKSADVYPIKFMDISENHEVVFGTDPFDQVEVHKENLRLRCEQELRNILLRLRYVYVKNEGDLRPVRMETKNTLYPIMNNLEVIIMLKKDKIINDYEQILSAMHSELDIDVSSIRELKNWHDSGVEINHSDFLNLFSRYQKLLDQLIQIVDLH
ncbi:MAG: hypothetical protein R2799_13000 [Crocinitomicaceae bacterium]